MVLRYIYNCLLHNNFYSSCIKIRIRILKKKFIWQLICEIVLVMALCAVYLTKCLYLLEKSIHINLHKISCTRTIFFYKKNLLEL